MRASALVRSVPPLFFQYFLELLVFVASSSVLSTVDSKLPFFPVVSLLGRSRFPMISSCLGEICRRRESIVFLQKNAPISWVHRLRCAPHLSWLPGSRSSWRLLPRKCRANSSCLDASFLIIHLLSYYHPGLGGIRWMGNRDRELDMEILRIHTGGTHKERPANASNSSQDSDTTRSQQHSLSLTRFPTARDPSPIALPPRHQASELETSMYDCKNIIVVMARCGFSAEIERLTNNFITAHLIFLFIAAIGSPLGILHFLRSVESPHLRPQRFRSRS